MSDRPDHARQFWSAAFFYRRAPERARSMALTVLEHVAKNARGLVKARAAKLLKEIQNELTSTQG